VQPNRWLMERAGTGVRLTQAGHLPPAFVTEATAQLYPDHWYGKGNREVHSPLLYLRESARRFGLVRSYRGKLVLTKLGAKLIDDPGALWWHIAGSLPDARSDVERDAGVLYLLAIAAGRVRNDALLVEGMATLGWVEAGTREPMTDASVWMATRDTVALFHRLHVLPASVRDEPLVAPPAAVRLARAALVGRLGRASTPSQRRTPGPAVELTVSLRDIEPPIWRRVVVPASLTLRELHGVIQTAMGWEDCHLYGFDVDGVLYTTLEDVQLRVLGDLDAFTVGEAAEVASMFTYEYDYGDDWDHVIRVERVLPVGEVDSPQVIDGARACPPEDCGGIAGYEQLLEALADDAHPQHEEVLRWLGGEFDPESFNLATTNARLQQRQRPRRLGRR